MSDRAITRGVRGFIEVVALALIAVLPTFANQRPDSRQTQVLVDLATQILSCSVHPCRGESQQAVRTLLRGQIVSDGTFYFSDLAVAYPSVGHVLRGLVEWDFDSALDMVSLKVADFHIAPAVLVAQLQTALPGCEMEQEEDGETEGESEAWSCLADDPEGSGVLVEVFFAPGIVLLEIGG
jgi:hypothetical protein